MLSKTIIPGDFEKALLEFTPLSLRDVKLQKSTVSWSDIGGKCLQSLAYQMRILLSIRPQRDSKGTSRNSGMADEVFCHICKMPTEAKIRVKYSLDYLKTLAERSSTIVFSCTGIQDAERRFLLPRWRRNAVSTSSA